MATMTINDDDFIHFLDIFLDLSPLCPRKGLFLSKLVPNLVFTLTHKDTSGGTKDLKVVLIRPKHRVLLV